MDTLQIVLSAISFFVMPNIVQFLTAKHASGAVKSAVLSVLSILIGVATTLLEGGFTGPTLASNIMVIVVSSIAGYKLLLKDFSSVFGDIGLQLGSSTAPPAPTVPPIAVTVVDKDSVQT